MPDDNRIVTYPDFRETFGIKYGREHLRRLIKKGSFPAPTIKLSPRLNGWRARDISDWINEKAA